MYIYNSSESGYQCVRLVKRDENILEMFLGKCFSTESAIKIRSSMYIPKTWNFPYENLILVV